MDSSSSVPGTACFGPVEERESDHQPQWRDERETRTRKDVSRELKLQLQCELQNSWVARRSDLTK